MTAHTDPDLNNWIFSILDCRKVGNGSFILAVATAAVRADDDNYAILRSALLALKAKYPKYE